MAHKPPRACLPDVKMVASLTCKFVISCLSCGSNVDAQFHARSSLLLLPQDVPELSVFEAVAAWCQVGQHATASIEAQTQQLTTEDSLLPHDQSQQQQLIVSHRNQAADSKVLQDKESAVQAATEYGGLGRSTEDMLEVLQLVRFAFMTEADRQVRTSSYSSYAICSLDKCWRLLCCQVLALPPLSAFNMEVNQAASDLHG